MLEQLAQRQRWPQGTAAYSAAPSKQMAHSAVIGSVEAGLGGSGLGSSKSSSPSAPSLPLLDAAVLVMYGFAATLSSSQVRTVSWMSLAARLRCLRRSFLRLRSHVRA